jgi:hypothetical protein
MIAPVASICHLVQPLAVPVPLELIPLQPNFFLVIAVRPGTFLRLGRQPVAHVEVVHILQLCCRCLHRFPLLHRMVFSDTTALTQLWDLTSVILPAGALSTTQFCKTVQ